MLCNLANCFNLLVVDYSSPRAAADNPQSSRDHIRLYSTTSFQLKDEPEGESLQKTYPGNRGTFSAFIRSDQTRRDLWTGSSVS